MHNLYQYKCKLVSKAANYHDITKSKNIRKKIYVVITTNQHKQYYILFIFISS